MTMRLLSLPFLATLLVLPACNADSGESASEGIETETDPKPEPEPEGATEPEPEPEPEPQPISCGDMTCAEGQICVEPGDECDYDLDPPDWVSQPPVCADVPADCAGKQGDEQANCLGNALCKAFDGVPYVFENGSLECPIVDLDCFEDGPIDERPTCGEELCDQGEICVVGAPVCVTEGEDQGWNYPAPVCEAIPEICSADGGDAFAQCLESQLCSGFADEANGSFENDWLTCPYVEGDCGDGMP